MLYRIPHVRRRERRQQVRPARHRAQVARNVEASRCVSRRARSREEEILHHGDVPLSVGAHAHGARAQLHHRRRGGARAPHARRSGALPDGLGRVRVAGGERGHQGQGPSAHLDDAEHRPHARAVRAARAELRLGSRSHDVRARIFRARAAHLHRDVQARAGLSQGGAGQLVSRRSDGAGERAGRGRAVLALPLGRAAARARAVVPQGHGVCRRALEGRAREARGQVARQGPAHAGALDRALRGRAHQVRARRRLGRHRGVHDAARYALRRDLHVDCGGASARQARDQRGADVRRGRGQGRQDQAHRRGLRQARRRYGIAREEPGDRRGDPGLRRQLRAHGLRHGRGHGGAGARSARFRVRDQVFAE